MAIALLFEILSLFPEEWFGSALVSSARSSPVAADSKTAKTPAAFSVSAASNFSIGVDALRGNPLPSTLTLSLPLQ